MMESGRRRAEPRLMQRAKEHSHVLIGKGREGGRGEGGGRERDYEGMNIRKGNESLI